MFIYIFTCIYLLIVLYS